MRYLAAILIVLCLTGEAAQAENTGANPLVSQQQKLGYALGADIGASLRKMTTDIDIDTLAVGLKDAFQQKDLLLSRDEIVRLKLDLSRHSKAMKKEKHDKLVFDSIQSGASFLKKNKQSDGVKVTDSGLQYLVVTNGSGLQTSKDDYVVVSYEGKLIDGTIFESVGLGEAKPKMVSSFVVGLQEGLQLMSTGGHYKIFIPARLAYGHKGYKTSVPPYSVLIYDIVLHKVTKRAVGKRKPTAVNVISPTSGTISASPPTKDKKSVAGEQSKDGLVPDYKIDFSRINLETLNSASYSVYIAYTAKINPDTMENDLDLLCEELATREFAATCASILSSRLSYIKKLIHDDKVFRADFLSVKRRVEKKDKMVNVTWIDRFEQKDKSVAKNDKILDMEFENINGRWKLNNLNLKQ